MEIKTESKVLKQRVKQLEAALKAMLEVAWPNPDLPDSRTNRANQQSTAGAERCLLFAPTNQESR